MSEEKEAHVSEQTQIDIRIDSTDPSVVGAIKAVVRPLEPRRLEKHRDVGTILAIDTSAVSLAKGLIELWKELKSLKNPTPVTVEAESGKQLQLDKVESEDEIRQFVADAS